MHPKEAREDRSAVARAERLAAYFSTAFDSPCRVPRVRQLSGGWSRTTFVVELEWAGGEELPREVVLRGETKGGLLKTPLSTEYRVLEALQGSRVPVPRLYGFEGGSEVLGIPFFVMECVDGFTPNLWRSEDRARLKAGRLRDRLGEQLVTVLAAVHEVDWRAHGLEILGAPGPGTEYAKREVALWEERYREVQPEPSPILEEALAWMRSNPPVCDRAVLVDGDYRVGNMILGDEGIRAVLDWELATIGDRVRDLGYTTLEYIGGKFLRRGRYLCNGVIDAEEFVSAYERRTELPVDREALRFWQVFGAFCLITIMYTGLHEFLNGRNHDVRMAWALYGSYSLQDDIARILDF